MKELLKESCFLSMSQVLSTICRVYYLLHSVLSCLWSATDQRSFTFD